MKIENIFVLVVVLCIIGAMPIFAASSESSSENVLGTVSLSLVNQDPDPAIAGDTVEVRIGLANSGGSQITDYVTEIVPSYPFELVAGEDPAQKIDTLEKYQGSNGGNTQIVKYRVAVNKDAPAGRYNLKLMTYVEGTNVRTISNFPIDVEAQQSAEIVHIDKTLVVPGVETELTFTINNVGSSPLRDLTFYWENEDGILLPVGSDNTKYIKYIDVGQSADVSYKVIADTNADPGLYKLDLHLSYMDSTSGSENTISTIAGVYVGGGTDFDISFSESSGSEMTFSIANVGSNEAYSVSVIVPSQSGWSVSGSNSAIIGNLDKGDYTVATFTLQQAASGMPVGGMRNESAASQQASRLLKMQIAYTDTMGQRQTANKSVAMSSSSGSFNSTSTTMGAGGYENFPGGQRRRSTPVLTYALYIGGALVLIGGFFVYRKYKTEKLVNTKYRLADAFSSLFRKKDKKSVGKN